MSNRAVQAVAFLVAAATAGPAGATSAVPANTEQNSVVVHYKPSDLDSSAGADAVSGVSSANLTTAYNRHFPNQPLIDKERLSERLQALIILVVG